VVSCGNGQWRKEHSASIPGIVPARTIIISKRPSRFDLVTDQIIRYLIAVSFTALVFQDEPTYRNGIHMAVLEHADHTRASRSSGYRCGRISDGERKG
jgi:hypothetical protein